MPKAELLLHRKLRYDNGAVLELKLWKVAVAVPGSKHVFKYSLYYGKAGQRLVGYDNEAGKGDHRHYADRQEPYAFITFSKMLADFLADVRQLQGGKL